MYGETIVQRIRPLSISQSDDKLLRFDNINLYCKITFQNAHVTPKEKTYKYLCP